MNIVPPPKSPLSPSSIKNIHQVPRILIADERPVEALAIESMLQRDRYQHIRVTNDVREIVPMLDSWGFDLLIMDMHATLIDGAEILRKLAKQVERGELSLIAITNPGHEPARLSALVAGASDALIRPVSQTDLLPMVRHALNTKAWGLGITT
ncbi:MAG: response regulator [Magnetovibrio sp.]|nr:response regulator [Magnetovibrio sp.]